MIFVTGGTGLVGSYLLLSLCEKEESIRALKRKSSSTSAVKQLFKQNNAAELFEKIQWIEGDLDDVHSLDDCLRGVNRVFHAAGYVSFDERKKRKILDTNVKGTENLINVCISLKVKEFIFFSSIAALGGSSTSDCIDESADWNNEPCHSTYALSKFKAEMNVWRASQEGIKVLVLCPSVIIGSLDGERSSESLFKMTVQKTAYTTTGGTGFVDVRDVIKATLMLVEQNIFNEKYILSSENRTYKEVQTFLREKANRKAPKLISNNMLSFLYYIFKIGALFGRESMSKTNYKSLLSSSLYSNEKIVNELNFSFIPIDEALVYHFDQYNKLRS